MFIIYLSNLRTLDTMDAQKYIPAGINMSEAIKTYFWGYQRLGLCLNNMHKTLKGMFIRRPPSTHTHTTKPTPQNPLGHFDT